MPVSLNWSGIKELPLTLQTGMSGVSLLIPIPQIYFKNFIPPKRGSQTINMSRLPALISYTTIYGYLAIRVKLYFN